LLAGCTARPAPTYEVTVRVDSDPGVGLAGAQLSLLGRPLGTTDAQGRFFALLRGASGETVELHVLCPAGHRSPSEPLRVRLRAPTGREERPEYHLLCPPLLRRLLLAVRADGAADMPVRVLGHEIAHTDGQGVAHALLTVAPGETVMVELDTRSRRHGGLMPQNPALRIEMPEHDEVVLFDQAFHKPAPPRRVRLRREPLGPQPI
jgi:hypothetical protein